MGSGRRDGEFAGAKGCSQVSLEVSSGRVCLPLELSFSCLVAHAGQSGLRRHMDHYVSDRAETQGVQVLFLVLIQDHNCS